MGSEKPEKEEKPVAKKPKPKPKPVQQDPGGTVGLPTPPPPKPKPIAPPPSKPIFKSPPSGGGNDNNNDNPPPKPKPAPVKLAPSPPQTADNVGGIQGDPSSIVGSTNYGTPAKPPVLKPAPPKKKKPSGIGITISSNTGGSNTGVTISTGNVYKDPVTGSTIQTGQTVKDVKEGKYNPSVIDSTTGNFLGEDSTPTEVEAKNTTLGKAKGSGFIPAGPQSTKTVSIETPKGVAAVKNLGGKITGHKGTDMKVANPYGEGSPIGAGEGTIAAGSYVSNSAVKKQTDEMIKTMEGDSTPSTDLLTGKPIVKDQPVKLNPAFRRALLSLGQGANDTLRRIASLKRR